jgi:hypothetical protein
VVQAVEGFSSRNIIDGIFLADDLPSVLEGFGVPLIEFGEFLIVPTGFP